MNNNEACAAYFKSRKEYKRCFQELLKKWKSYGRAAGKITLKAVSEEERRAIGGLLGKTFYETDLCFNVSEFEKRLQKTRFAPVELEKILEAYFGEGIQTNQSRLEKEQQKKEDFFHRNLEFFTGTAAGLWIETMVSSKKCGYLLLMREYGKAPGKAEELLQNVGNAIKELEEIEEELPLAVFAARISGNPHYFDRGSTAGLLLVHALSYREKSEVPENAQEWRDLLESVKILPDNLSSQVHAYGLRLRSEDGWHPAYEAFCERHEPCVITMENLRGMTGAGFFGKTVYVVENEMVFSYLINSKKTAGHTLLCTSGQLRAAGIKLLVWLIKSGATVFYSGDTDPDGLGIADRLWKHFGDVIHIWHMGPEDYEKSLSGEEIGPSGLAKLTNIDHPELQKTASCIRKHKKAGYQENLLEQLEKDLEHNL